MWNNKKINFHDTTITKYQKKGNNIILELKDGWDENICYRLELINVNIQVQKYPSPIISYAIDKLNKINIKKLNIYSGDYGQYDETKFFLKLWIDYPLDIELSNNNDKDTFEFDGITIELSDEYDDIGQLFIKFITDHINIE